MAKRPRDKQTKRAATPHTLQPTSTPRRQSKYYSDSLLAFGIASHRIVESCGGGGGGGRARKTNAAIPSCSARPSLGRRVASRCEDESKKRKNRHGKRGRGEAGRKACRRVDNVLPMPMPLPMPSRMRYSL
ncbi:hypothetical protein V9T40_004664 [Parthenolecanium corni]|uniref:Uncharacterized protein n=1 Tax=Parthenolecanium corni TaxID=536013 RepID=A0AAN9TTL2_9HEMI